MSINKLISIKVPVYQAFDDMGKDITKDIPVFTRWATYAEREIGSRYAWRRKRVVLEVMGCRAKLPSTAMSVKMVVIGDHGCDCEELLNQCAQSIQSINPAIHDSFFSC